MRVSDWLQSLFPLAQPFTAGVEPAIFALSLVHQRDRRDCIEPRDACAIEFLEDLAEHFAGCAFRSEVTNLKKSFALIAEELRHQYRLGFYPGSQAKAGTWHSLRVEVARPDVVVRARKEYRDNVRSVRLNTTLSNR